MRATASYRTFAPSLYLSRPVFGQPSRKTRGTQGSRFDRYSPELRAQRWHKQCRKFALLLLAFFLLSRNVTPAEINELRRVLVFNDFDPVASPGIALLDQAIFTAISQSRYSSNGMTRVWELTCLQTKRPNATCASGTFASTRTASQT
jgi:hypothetical protein